jgi:hypothetical protein
MKQFYHVFILQKSAAEQFYPIFVLQYCSIEQFQEKPEEEKMGKAETGSGKNGGFGK